MMIDSDRRDSPGGAGLVCWAGSAAIVIRDPVIVTQSAAWARGRAKNGRAPHGSLGRCAQAREQGRLQARWCMGTHAAKRTPGKGRRLTSTTQVVESLTPVGDRHASQVEQARTSNH